MTVMVSVLKTICTVLLTLLPCLCKNIFVNRQYSATEKYFFSDMNGCINTYVSYGKNGAGPIRLNPAATKAVPTTVTIFGDLKLSHIHPNNGAVTA